MAYQPLLRINKEQALYRGRPPPNVDRVATEQVLEDGEKDLDVYSAELARLHSETVRLEQKKAVLTEYLDRHRSSVASIWRIPNEVLALIFTLVCCERVRINQPPLADFRCGANLPQLLIGSVCSVWRSILHSLPDCWTKFAVSFSASMPHPSLIQMFLDLSDPKNLFLDITFSEDSDHQKIIAHPSYSALIGQVHRWQELILFGSQLENIEVLRQPTIKACPRLKRLRLDGFFAVGVEPQMDLAPMPLLERLEACLYDPYGPDPSIPWHQLKSLQLHAAVDIPTCLALCENLFSLSLYMRETTLQYSTEPSSKSVTLKSLRSFMLLLTPLVPAGEEGGAESMNQIVDLLSFPSIRK
ncbi:hypothetical protein D9757_007303 [Collybiopsis confluens]|uniref:F-box domain-containing protein n=1 Tax=Collybiopsis confluens TaxID=2823264 RepID=A0A8H5M6B2_9AGAR|nr:hypothetical protein D9757_007303 [Collybiopsis confluens]